MLKLCMVLGDMEHQKKVALHCSPLYLQLKLLFRSLKEVFKARFSVFLAFPLHEILPELFVLAFLVETIGVKDLLEVIFHGFGFIYSRQAFVQFFNTFLFCSFTLFFGCITGVVYNNGFSILNIVANNMRTFFFQALPSSFITNLPMFFVFITFLPLFSAIFACF